MKKAICYIIIAMLTYEPLMVSTADVSEVATYNTTIVETEEISPIMDDVETISLGVCKLTAYCKENYPHVCNNGDSSSTATGTTPTVGRTVAVDPRIIPYGSEVIINGHTYIAEDCGGAIKGNRVDILFATHQEALEFGIQYADVSYVTKGVISMCQECRQTPCDPRCPNAPEPPVVYECDNCGREIREGDTMWELDIGIVCETCIDGNWKYAEKEEDY